MNDDLAAFPLPEAAPATGQVMPHFVFARRRDIELEAGFTLAGDLIEERRDQRAPRGQRGRVDPGGARRHDGARGGLPFSPSP